MPLVPIGSTARIVALRAPPVPTSTPLAAGTRRLRATLVASLALGVVSWLGPPVPAAAQAGSPTPVLVVELEGAPTWQSYNDVEIPNDGSATRFSLYDLVGAGPWLAGRVYVTWNAGERHGLRVLAAPFTLTEEGVPAADLRFAGADYDAGVPARATYRFDSYRLTYRYRFYEGARTTAWVGFTGKIRDARVALAQGATSSEKTDLGFVPLLHVAGDWRFTPGWILGLDADALAGGPGRAEDVTLRLGWEASPWWSVHVGYRMVEGGADVDEVYTFAWLHYATLTFRWRVGVA